MLRGMRERLPPNAGRAWLRTGGIGPRRCALFHSLNQRLDSRFPRAVATFHDLFVITGQYSSPEFRARFTAQARQAAEHADLIIAVSRFTAEQVISLLAVERSRVRVIHHGVHLPAAPPPEDASRENVILHVGAIQTRKNLVRLVEAFEQTPSGWRLILAGSRGFGAEEFDARVAASPRRGDIELRGYVSAPELERLYARARVFAFPSLDEGFGMPVLDAMARGVPVLTSCNSALVEVAGEAALTVDPLQTESITDGLIRLTSDPELRQIYKAKGLLRASEFSWRKTVEATWSVYGELI